MGSCIVMLKCNDSCCIPRLLFWIASSNVAMSDNTDQYLQSSLIVKTCTWGHHVDPRKQCTWSFWQRLFAWIWSSQVNHYDANAWTVVLFLLWHAKPIFQWQNCRETRHLSLRTAGGMSMLWPEVWFCVHLSAALAPTLHTFSENQAIRKQFRAAVSETSGGIYQRVPKLWRSGSAKLLAAHFPSILASPGRLTTMVFVVHIGSVFSEFPAPSSDYNVRSIHVAQLVVNLCWRLILNVQKSDNCKNLAVGGRQYQCSIFLVALCNNYRRHKTETALYYFHVLPLWCYACAFPSY